MSDQDHSHTVRGYCGFCAVHCPTLATVAGNTVLRLDPDPDHPYGGAICSKGRAAPDFLDHNERVNYPLRRTRPKGDPDPGWQRISWGEALDTIAAKLLDVRSADGAQAVAFSKGTSGGTGLNEAEPWLGRLAAYFGSPNLISTTHLCQWPRDTGAAFYTFGVDRLPMPDVANSACLILWGSNPNSNFLSLAQDIVAARARGMKLLIVDPRRVGQAAHADVFLQVRPGSDGALALSLIHVLLAETRFDEGFVRDWTNAPLLLRADTGELLRPCDLPSPDTAGDADADQRDGFAIHAGSRTLTRYNIARGTYACPSEALAIRGSTDVRLRDGTIVRCETVLERLARQAAPYAPQQAAGITGVPAAAIEAAARLVAENRPVSHYYHNGLVQHTNATQACRAIAVLYALLGDWDRAGGNVVAPGPRLNPIVPPGALDLATAGVRLGLDSRPIGPPARPGNVTAYDVYDAILDGNPYRVRALVGFGGNLLLAHGDSRRGAEALRRLEFFAQAELTHTPTSDYADILLPVTSFMESEALHLGFRYPAEAIAHVQRRPAVVPALHDRRSDVSIIFDLACRLELGERFWHGDIAAGYNHVLEPAGLTWDALAGLPQGVAAPAYEQRPQKYAAVDPRSGETRGFATPSRKVELYSLAFAERGQPPLPEYREPELSPVSRPDMAADFPLVLTNAKRPQYLHSQHRGLARLRRAAPHPTAELHPDTAARFGIENREWIALETPSGRVRLQARFSDAVMPGVVCASHGWWQGCEELGLPALDPLSDDGANVNLLVDNEAHDPISGGTPHRSTLCRLRKLD